MSSINSKISETDEKLKSVFSYLSSADPSTKNIAIHSYLKLLEKGAVPEKYQERMFSFIQEELQNEESSIHTELYEILSKSNFTSSQSLASLVPILKKVFQSRNRFRIKWALKLVSGIQDMRREIFI